MELNEFLLWLIGPGAGIAAYYVIKNFYLEFAFRGRVHVWTFQGKGPKYLRRAGLILPGALAAAAYALGAVLGYTVAPDSAQAWGEALFQVASAAVVAQVMHGESELT